MFPFIDKSPPHCQVELSIATTYKTGRKEGKSEPKGTSSTIAVLSAAWAGAAYSQPSALPSQQMMLPGPSGVPVGLLCWLSDLVSDC